MDQTLNILAIEDNPADFLLLERHLRQHGMDVICHRVDTPEALEHALGTDGWDIILSDFSVPRLNFYDSFARIQACLPDLPVILVSGSVGEEQAVELLKLGVWDFILKDNLTRLVPAIERCSREFEDRKSRLSAEKSLQESEYRFRSIFNSSPIAIGIGRRDDGRLVEVNNAWLQLYGASRDEVIGRTTSDLNLYVRDDERSEMIRIINDHGHIVNREVQLRRRSGDIVLVQYSAELIKLGEDIYLQVMMTDITEQKRLETDLIRSERMHRSLFDNMLNGFAYCRMLFDGDTPQDFIYLSVNDAFKRQTGLTDVVGKRVTEVIPGIRESDPVLFEKYGRVAMTGNPEQFEIYVEALKEWFWVSLYSPAKEHFVAVFDVITSRKQAEETLRKLYAAVVQSPTAVMITDINGIIEYVNPRFTQATGYSYDEAIGQTPQLLKGDTSDDIYRSLWETISEGNVWEGDLHNRKKDGTLYWEHATISPIRNEAGVMTHYMYIREDITERRILEEQLRQSQKMEAVGQLAGGVAHDFNNIMQVIMGNAQLQSMFNRQHDLSCKYVDEIFMAVEHGASLTKSLLVFSRKQPMELSCFDLNGLVRDSHKLASRLVTEEISLTLKLYDQALKINGDAGLVQHVVFNLVTNARDAISRQGSITISTDRVTVDRDFMNLHGADSADGHFALLTVKDTGCGISDEIMDRIFEPFFTTKETGKGTGLGLAMIYGTVRQMGGFINVDTQAGAGTAIEIYIPLSNDIKAVPAASDMGTYTYGKDELLLIVEDEKGVRDTLSHILKISNYRVECAANAEEAIKLARENSSELRLVIMDMILPGLNGIETAGELHLIRQDLPILFLSGYSDEALESKGITGYHLRKPVLPSHLLQNIRRLLDEQCYNTRRVGHDKVDLMPIVTTAPSS